MCRGREAVNTKDTSRNGRGGAVKREDLKITYTAKEICRGNPEENSPGSSVRTNTPATEGKGRNLRGLVGRMETSLSGRPARRTHGTQSDMLGVVRNAGGRELRRHWQLGAKDVIYQLIRSRRKFGLPSREPRELENNNYRMIS